MKKATILILVIGFMSTSCATKVVHTTPVKNKVVVVSQAPKNHKILVIKGKRYYKWNGKHYRKTRRGYVAVTL